MFGLGGQELLIIIVLAAVLLFGATRLPKLGRSLGQSVRGFKKGLSEDVPDDEADAAAKPQDNRPPDDKDAAT